MSLPLRNILLSLSQDPSPSRNLFTHDHSEYRLTRKLKTLTPSIQFNQAKTSSRALFEGKRDSSFSEWPRKSGDPRRIIMHEILQNNHNLQENLTKCNVLKYLFHLPHIPFSSTGYYSEDYVYQFIKSFGENTKRIIDNDVFF